MSFSGPQLQIINDYIGNAELDNRGRLSDKAICDLILENMSLKKKVMELSFALAHEKEFGERNKNYCSKSEKKCTLKEMAFCKKPEGQCELPF